MDKLRKIAFSPHCYVKLCDSEVSQIQSEVSVDAINEFYLSMQVEYYFWPLKRLKKKKEKKKKSITDKAVLKCE